MARPVGRPPGSVRLRAMRFALWASKQPKLPEACEIARLLDISNTQANHWRADWLDAIGPFHQLPGERHAATR